MKNMKKKVVIIATMVLLLAVVLVMSVSTFAKYSTTATPSTNNATVAKWGFVLTADADELFGKEYGAATDNLASVVAAGSGVNVKAATGTTKNIVAPGTTGSATITVNGTAEVLAKLTISVTGTDISLTKDAATYNPIKWTLNDGSSDVVSNGTLAELNAYTATFAAGEEVNKTYTVTWTWALNNAATGIDGLSVDAADTMLATGATTGYTAVTDLSFEIGATIEQIQQ